MAVFRLSLRTGLLRRRKLHRPDGRQEITNRLAPYRLRRCRWSAIRAPATAGPALRETLKMMEWSPMALVMMPSGTASPIMAARDGC